MKKTKYVQSCKIGEPGAKRSSVVKKVRPVHRSTDKKVMQGVFNKYYKQQVAALYRAVQEM
ncbi:MAG: hypothetical protein HQ594_05615 [Candidatus Omnitrophica bacterium]|nr:hypothetical protein [Candidatus Omnitrophota bacterium]